MTPIEHWTLWCWIAFWVIWIAAWFYQKPAKWEQGASERSSYSLLLMLASVLVLTSFENPWPAALGILPRAGGVMWLGFILTLLGLLFAVWARFALGANWSRSMDLKESHELVTAGPYALVRHPIYAGLLLMFAGSTLVIGTFTALIGFALAIWSCLIRVRTEDRFLAANFPDAYPSYAARVKRLIPFIY